MIGDTECAREDVQVMAPDSYGPSAYLTIPPASERAGCGAPGVTVRFIIDGRPTNETVAWAPGAAAVEMTFSVGAPFARYSGDFRPPPGFVGVVTPMIGATVCGVALGATLGEGPTYGFDVVVDSAARTPGCGTPGAVVRFRFDRYRANGTAPTGIFADQTVAWQPGGAAALNLTFSSASALPASGDGAAHAERVGWPAAAAAFALLGVTVLLAGALRVVRP